MIKLTVIDIFLFIFILYLVSKIINNYYIYGIKYGVLVDDKNLKPSFFLHEDIIIYKIQFYDKKRKKILLWFYCHCGINY
jgi:hypothetical protein